MAGIAGLFDVRCERGPAGELAGAMLAAIAHRGRGPARALVDPPVMLAQRGAGVFDGDSAARYPLASADERLWLVYDGDVCNGPEVAEELRRRGRRPRSESDAEVVLLAYEEWGERALDRLNGSFALAVWDRERRLLFCARDRFGLKPFHYVRSGGRFLFASEPKALFADPSVTRRANDARVLDFLAYELVDHTHETLFEGVMRLPAGGSLTIGAGNGAAVLDTWYRLGPAELGSEPPDAAVRELLTDAVSIRLRGEEPVGVGLSGGVDSSSVLALAARLRQADGAPVPPSFSSRTNDPRVDEWPHAQRVVRATGSENFTTLPDERSVIAELDGLMWLMDEPVHGLSVFGHYKLMELAAQHGVRVLLEGQAGDDVFTGVDTWYPHIFYSLLRDGRIARAWHEARARASVQGAPVGRSAVDLAKLLVPNRFRGVRGIPAWLVVPPERRAFPRRGLRGQQRYELEVFTLPRNSREVDRNSSRFGIQARAPFLDHRVVEYGFALPPHVLVRDGRQKVPVREAMRGIVPREIIERPDKQGFTVDEGAWIRAGLGRVIEDAFRSPEASARPYWDADALLRTLEEHRAGADRTADLWRAYSVERWLELFVDPFDLGLVRGAPDAAVELVEPAAALVSPD